MLTKSVGFGYTDGNDPDCDDTEFQKNNVVPRATQHRLAGGFRLVRKAPPKELTLRRRTRKARLACLSHVSEAVPVRCEDTRRPREGLWPPGSEEYLVECIGAKGVS